MVAAHRPDLEGTGLAVPFAVGGPVFAAFIEELIFRGVLLSTFLSVTRPAVAIVLAAVLSTLVHATNAEFASQWLFYFAFSIFLGFVTFRANSLLPSIAIHVSLNFVGNLVFLFVGPWNPATLSDAWQSLLLGCALVSGAIVVALGRSTRKLVS